MNILIDGHSLSTLGGMERVTCDLASAMAARGHTVFVFIADPLPVQPLYAVDDRVQFVLYTHHGRQGHIPAFRRQILDCAPDLCVSPAGDRRHLPWCAALYGTGIPLLISEHSAPEAVETVFWNRSERLAVMAAADAIHLLRPSCLHTLPQHLQNSAVIIPNAVTLSLLPKVAAPSPTIVSLGRLERDKQNHLLIDAFALLVGEYPQWHVDIWGKGPEQGRLQKSIEQHRLQKNVFLRGLTSHPEDCYAKAAIVCMPSLHEGFGCVVTEALTAGIPVVGFSECSGVNELITHQKTGLLAPDMTAASLAESLRTLMADSALRNTMGAEGQSRAKAWTPKTVYDAWEEVFFKVAKNAGKTRLQTFEHSDSLSPAFHDHAKVLLQCISRANVLVGDGQFVRRLVFQFPWIKRMVYPLYTWYKHLHIFRTFL